MSALRVAAGAGEQVGMRRPGRRGAGIHRLRYVVEYVHDARTLSRMWSPLAVDRVFTVRWLGAARGMVRDAMKHFALIYEMVENFAERRKPFRQAHLQLINDAHARGLIVMAGAMGDPPDGGLLIFRADSPAAVEEFVHADPYVKSGIVTGWRVRQWNVVIGDDAAAPKAL